jgi:hypothetical protein
VDFLKFIQRFGFDGGYDEWDSKKQQLIRFGNQGVVLKRLENVESADQRWFEEVC